MLKGICFLNTKVKCLFWAFGRLLTFPYPLDLTMCILSALRYLLHTDLLLHKFVQVLSSELECHIFIFEPTLVLD